MAEVFLDDLDPFSCPVCLEALRHPVTIPCGHNYCMSCIKDYWRKHGSEDTGYSCPQCRKSFSPRPVLNKNTMFAEVVERFRNTGLHDPPASRYDRPTQRENCKNSKVCTSDSLCCQTHLRYCSSDFPREKHTVIVVSGEPRGNTCFWPNRPSYCGIDPQLICPSRLDEARRGSFPPEKTRVLERKGTLPHEHRSKDRTNGRDRKQEKIQGTGHQQGHRSGQTRGAQAQRGTETHRRSGHTGKTHGHRHNAGHSRRRLGVLVMTGAGPQRTIMDKIRAL